MRRFQFRLDSVLEWRRVQLELEETKLQRLFEELHRIEFAKARLKSEETEAARAVLESASVAASELTALETHRHWVQREQARLDRLRADCDQRLAAQRERVANAERDLRLFEKVKERRYEEWRLAADREQEALAGELFLARWGRK